MKWVIGIIMAIVMVSGASMLTATSSADKMQPKSMADLSPFTVTIKSITVQPAGVQGPQVLTPMGYDTKFIVMKAPALATDVNVMALAGQKATVYLRSKDADMLLKGGLGLNAATWAYGIQLQGGKVLSDPAEVLASSSSKTIVYGPMFLIGIPVLYFLFLFLHKGKDEKAEAKPAAKRRSTREERLGLVKPPSGDGNT